MFVPVVPPFSTSARAQELSRQLVEAIEGFRRSHPDLKAQEVEAALRLAARETSGLRQAKLAVLLGIAALSGVVALILSRSGGSSGASAGGETSAQPAWILAALGAILAVAVAMVFLRRR